MEAIVLYPCPGIGHLLPMLELSKLIHGHSPHLSIHILINNPPINLGSIAPHISSISAVIPSITFHHLHALSPPLDPTSFPSLQALIFKFLCLMTPHVQTILQSLSISFTIRAFVLDLLCTPSLNVATALDIPAYYFFASGTCCLALFLYFPTIHKNTTKSFVDTKNLLHHVPSLPLIPSSHMPDPLLDRTTVAYTWFLDCMIQLPKSSGIIVNTFESLEQKSLVAITDELCVPNSLTPSVYCVGPLNQSCGEEEDGDGNSNSIKCLKWLNSQPTQSVVFLCFGSLGLFSKVQLKEIAVGLENSRHRFLWVVRDPEGEYSPDLDALLPDGFFNRTKDRGLVVKSWAPQVAVLNHDSVGGFMTHCGWNSVLEAVCAGVPMIAWPLYAEQKFNKTILVEELRLALPMDHQAETGLVSAGEVERRVRELMDSDKGNSVKEKVLAMRGASIRGRSKHDGSSWLAMEKLVKSWKRKVSWLVLLSIM